MEAKPLLGWQHYRAGAADDKKAHNYALKPDELHENLLRKSPEAHGERAGARAPVHPAVGGSFQFQRRGDQRGF